MATMLNAHVTPALQYSQYTPYNQIYNYLAAGTSHGYVKTAAPHYTYTLGASATRNRGVGVQSVRDSNNPASVPTDTQNSAPHAVVAGPARVLTGSSDLESAAANTVLHPEVHYALGPVDGHYTSIPAGHHATIPHHHGALPTLPEEVYTELPLSHPAHHHHGAHHTTMPGNNAFNRPNGHNVIPYNHLAVPQAVILPSHHEVLQVGHHGAAQYNSGYVNHLGYIVPCKV